MTCQVEHCDRAVKARGLCGRHYENRRVNGDPIAQRDRPLWDRLADIGWSQQGSCMTWNGAVNEHGYGIFNHERVHRIVYAHFNGPLADDVVVRHSCDNPPCGRPEHLTVGSQADNVSDMVERRRHWRHVARSHCDAGHDLSAPGATRLYADGSRCVACRRIRGRRKPATGQELPK